MTFYLVSITHWLTFLLSRIEENVTSWARWLLLAEGYFLVTLGPMWIFIRQDLAGAPRYWLWGYTLRCSMFLKPATTVYWASGKESTCRCGRCKRCGFDPWVGKIPWSRKWQLLHSSCLENPWTEEPDGPQSVGLQRVRHDWGTEHTLQ